MKISRIAALCAAVFTGFAAISFAALSKDYADFPKGPAEYLLTKEDLDEWRSVQTDEQAKAFIERFWARRDPTPGTPANEFRDGYNNRVKTADERFHEPRVAGSLTDRGKVFIVLGAPTKLRRSRDVPVSTIQTGAQFDPKNPSIEGPQQYSPKEVWIYEQGKLDIKIGQPVVEVYFLDQYGTNTWTLERQPKTDIYAVIENVARSYVMPSVAVAAERPKQFQNSTLRAAIDDVRSGKSQSSPNLFVSVGEFITPAGEDFVPVQLYIPESASDDGAKVTFFGTIEKGDETDALIE